MNYHNITHCDQNNGDGLRVVLWLSGCSHHCIGCQNPQTWNKNSGILFDDNAKNEILEELNEDYTSGITFSGGDPLNENNLTDVLNFVTKIRNQFPDKTIWLYTGYTWEQIWNPLTTDDAQSLYKQLRQEIVKNTDVLVDGRYEDDNRDITLKWRGSSNQRVLDVRESIKQNKPVLYCD